MSGLIPLLTASQHRISFGRKLADIGIFTTNVGGTHDPSTQALIDEAKRQHLDVDVFHPQDCTLEATSNELGFWLRGTRHTSTPYDVVIPRLGARYITPQAMAVLRQLELLGTKLTNSSNAIAIAEDKFATHQYLAATQVNQPDTLYSQEQPDIQPLAALGHDIFIKANTATSGAKGIQRIKNPKATLPHASSKDVIHQKSFVNGEKSDYKYVFVNGQAVYASKECGRFEGGEKSCQEIAPDPAFVTVGKAAMKAIGLTVGSIDMIDGPEGPMVIEINPSSGFGPAEIPKVPQAILNYAQHLLDTMHKQSSKAA